MSSSAIKKDRALTVFGVTKPKNKEEKAPVE